MALSLLEMPSVCAVRTYYNTPVLPGGACAHIFCCLAPATTGLHGVVLLMDMDQWPTHVSCALRLMDKDHTVYIRCGLGSMAWMNDGNLTASASRPPHAVVDTYDGSRTGALCHVLKNRRSPDERGQR